jgi:hypothetical protein
VLRLYDWTSRIPVTAPRRSITGSYTSSSNRYRHDSRGPPHCVCTFSWLCSFANRASANFVRNRGWVLIVEMDNLYWSCVKLLDDAEVSLCHGVCEIVQSAGMDSAGLAWHVVLYLAFVKTRALP